MAYEDKTSEKLERMRREIAGPSPRRPGTPDPYDVRERRADVIKGRDREHYLKWRKVMTYYRFRYFTPEMVTRHVGPKLVVPSDHRLRRGHYYVREPHTEAQWRRDKPDPLAYTPDDLIQLFNDSPADFDAWMRKRLLKKGLMR